MIFVCIIVFSIFTLFNLFDIEPGFSPFLFSLPIHTFQTKFHNLIDTAFLCLVILHRPLSKIAVRTRMRCLSAFPRGWWSALHFFTRFFILVVFFCWLYSLLHRQIIHGTSPTNRRTAPPAESAVQCRIPLVCLFARSQALDLVRSLFRALLPPPLIHHSSLNNDGSLKRSNFSHVSK